MIKEVIAFKNILIPFKSQMQQAWQVINIALSGYQETLSTHYSAIVLQAFMYTEDAIEGDV